MKPHHLPESHHGVLMKIFDQGILIVGAAGLGKSSLALELLHHGHQLIADDIADFHIEATDIIGQCPNMLVGLLHSRELGLLPVSDLFGDAALVRQTKLNYVIQLQRNIMQASTLSPEKRCYSVCGKTLPMLILDVSTPSSLHHRISTWLLMQITHSGAETTLYQRQQHHMALQ